MGSFLKKASYLFNFYEIFGLGQDAYERRVNFAKIGFLILPFPNPKARQRLVYLHDVNHLLSGYDTSWVGEGEVSAWELASGFHRS